MNELRNDANLTTADIAHPQRYEEGYNESQVAVMDQGDTGTGQIIAGSKKVAGSQKTETSAAPLFPDNELQNFRTRWDQVQTSFVDEPRHAVEQADSLVANVVTRIAEQFSAEREQLEKQWGRGDDVSTEDLRQALRRYRSFFDRLLTF
jgi:hypothetical protein